MLENEELIYSSKEAITEGLLCSDDELQHKIFSENDAEEDTNIWDKSVKVEENLYYWKGEAIIKKGNPIASRPIDVA
jgi:hypothetical protein